MKKSSRTSKGLRSETTLMPWLIFFLAAAFYGYEFLQRVAISVYLPTLMPDLKLDASAIGIIGSTFYYAYAGMQIPSGVLIDWFGAKRLAAIGVLLVSLGALMFGFIHNTLEGSIARFIIGFGSAFAFVSCMKLVVVWFPPYRFALLAGLTNLIGYFGATLGERPLSYFVDQYGWRMTSIGAALFGFVLMILIVWIIKDKPYSVHPKANKPKKEAHVPSIFHGLNHVIKDGRNWLNGLYAGLMVGPTSAFAALWGITFLTTIDHFSKSIAATALSVIFVGVAVGSPFFGWLSDYLRKRQLLLIIASFGSLISTLLIIYLNTFSNFGIILLCFLFGFFQSAHVLNFAIAKDLNPKKFAGAALGFANMAVMLGGAILQPFIGLLLDLERHGSFFSNNITYTREFYHVALAAIPVCQGWALLIAIFGLKDLVLKTPDNSNATH